MKFGELARGDVLPRSVPSRHRLHSRHNTTFAGFACPILYILELVKSREPYKFKYDPSFSENYILKLANSRDPYIFQYDPGFSV
jgi:hypothetical protein